MGDTERREVSLSWLVVTTRDYKETYDWFLDKKHPGAYGVMKKNRTDCIAADLAREYCDLKRDESYYAECVLMPELQDLDIESAAEFLRKWCDENQIIYREDLDLYKEVEAYYWGVSDVWPEVNDAFT